MPIITKPTIGVTRNGDSFTFEVHYTYTFSDQERRFPEGFAESMELREDDKGEPFGGPDDFIHNRPIRTFVPNSNVVDRTFIFDLTRKELLGVDGEKGELGGEEYYARVHFRRNIPNVVSQTIDSDIFPLAI